MYKSIFIYGCISLAAFYILTVDFNDFLSSAEVEEHHHEEENHVHLTPEQIQQMGLQIQTAKSGSISLEIAARGKIILHPDRLAHIIPKMAGIALEANKNIGDHVQIGEVLAILESQAMADAKGAYLTARTKERLAASILKREERLYRERVSPEQDYLNAKNAYAEADIQLQLTAQKLQALGLNDNEIATIGPDLRLYKIRSPLTGTIIMRHITQGEFIDSTATIYEVADLSKVWVEIGIYPKDLEQVKQGHLVEISTPNGNKKAEAPLIFVSPIVGDETITARAIAELNNQGGDWRPGVFVKVNIATGARAFPIVVPKEAIQTTDDQNFMFIVTPDGFEKRYVQVGLSDQQQSAILAGLHIGERYVANKTFLLKAELDKGMAEHEH